MSQIFADKCMGICVHLRNLREKMAFSFLLLSFFSFSQDIPYRNQYFGLNAGVNLAFGTHVQRLGLVFNAAYVNEHFQANFETRYYFNFKDLGPRKKGEFAASLGVLYGYGKMNSWYNPFYNAVSNQTGYKYCFAYSFNTYVNKIRTSQRTGTIAFQIDRITVINENDLFAPPSFDAFRTGGLLIQYQQDSLFQAAINCTMWTGKMGFKTQHPDPHFRFGCYMDTTGNIYGNYSHGLLSAQVKYYAGYGQNAQANIGVDAEQVRNAIQNEISHDMNFLPASWIKSKNCHIPMLDDKGGQYLYRQDQKIRPAKLFLNIYSNQNLFY
jgi:hypothetical protein